MSRLSSEMERIVLRSCHFTLKWQKGANDNEIVLTFHNENYSFALLSCEYEGKVIIHSSMDYLTVFTYTNYYYFFNID